MEIKFQSVKPLSNHTVIMSWLIIVFPPIDSQLHKVAPEKSRVPSSGGSSTVQRPALFMILASTSNGLCKLLFAIAINS